ncbi:zinc finger CCCH-type antiviral protein 1-like [Gadus morhua]|uniref:zinc finger CCCH-type antiviral protein 1-like n=1 Tax=Gadus morhua TaxID=8049 RepID=UPI0011B7BF12|nr:zinc finger CCCH-type antiviral protein 1-like [Gadus morhua]
MDILCLFGVLHILICTVDVEAVCFGTMTCGLQKVRRLSSISSVLMPTLLLTTEWLWYWEEGNGNWNQYDSPPNSSTELEQKFQNDPQEVVEFTAGSHAYTLSLQDMIQTNKRHGTKRLVRRRPRFLSSDDVQDIRTRCVPPGGRTRREVKCLGPDTQVALKLFLLVYPL